MVPAEKQFECIDEQTNISSLSIELCCKKMAANYKRTAHQLDAILEDSKGAISPTLGGKILINTGDDKRLAKAIVDEVKHYFGDSKNKPKNTADAALIIDRSDDWLEGIKRSSAKTTHQEYIDLVVEKTRQKYAIDAESRANDEFTKSFDEIIKAVVQWADAKRKERKTKKADPLTSKPNNKHVCFCNKLSEDNARNLFQALYNKNYIKGEVSDWLIYCGIKDGAPTRRIDWMKGLNELAYFVAELFGTTNGNDLWSVTASVFSIKGTDINKASIKSLHSQCKIAKTKRTAIDDILSIVKRNNSVVNRLNTI